MGPSVESKEGLAPSPMRTKQQENFTRDTNTLNSHNINVDDNQVFKNLAVTKFKKNTVFPYNKTALIQPNCDSIAVNLKLVSLSRTTA
jgi:hypothetical protein